MEGDVVGQVTPARRIRVVVADDTPDMRLLLRVAMERRDDVDLVGEAANGLEAIDLAAALRPDLLALDLAMPVLDGLSALPRLAEVAPDTRVVILSAMPIERFEADALAAGAAAFVQKATSIDFLVDELLKGASLLDAVVSTLAVSIQIALSRDTASPSDARRFVTSALTDWRETHLIETVELLVTELVTNVILHTSTTPDVRVSLLKDHVHVEVRDADPSTGRPGLPPPSATSGRGLHLVNSLAGAWGTVKVSGGKVVWFDIPRA
jgi:DNA-binding NarL/FixJ family response regulator